MKIATMKKGLRRLGIVSGGTTAAVLLGIIDIYGGLDVTLAVMSLVAGAIVALLITAVGWVIEGFSEKQQP